METDDAAHAAARLRALDTCAVSDALDALSIAGVAHGLRSVAAAGAFAGPAVTVELVAADHARRTSGVHLGTTAIEAAPVGAVVVVDHGGRENVAGWGGLLSLAAVQHGIAAVVVDGAVRDVDEARALGLPVFARGAVPVTARGRVVERATNVPVSVAGLRVAPGDLVIGDGSGVVVVPRGRANEVLEVAAKVAARERRMAADLRRGDRVTQVLGRDYETMLEQRS